MARTQAVYYRDKHGVEPVNEFIEALSPRHAAKIDDYVRSTSTIGRPAPRRLSFRSHRRSTANCELRVRFASTRYRVLYQRSDNLVVLLHAIEKNTGAIGESDKRLAMQRMADFKRRMDASAGCRQGPRVKMRRLAAEEEVGAFIKIDKLVSR